jgi:hypothetical protein
VVGAAAALLLVAGCASLPDSGAVHSGVGASPSTSAAPFDFNPPGPQQGASRREIVAGFLRALQATPVSTRSAAEFLTPKAAAGWHPQQRTLVYRSQVTRLTPTGVSVHLRRAFGLDETGRWTGALRGDQRAVEIGVTRTDGEWRISSLPDATVIPSTHFERRYREYSLYFFDTGGRVLVPELVYLPWGVQTPTLLVSGLLAGPTGTARRVERSYFPPGTRLGVSVPVGPNGTAQVPLSREVLRLDSSRMDRVLAQLTWTLRQTDNVTRVQILVDGNPVELPGGGTTVNVMDYGEFSPAIASASTDLFGVRGLRVVQDVGAEEITAANLPAQDRAPRSMGVEMSGQRFAVVSADGGRVDVLGRTGAGSQPAATVYTGTDLLRPMWDHTDRLWLVDLRHSGPEVLVGKPDQLTRLALPHVAGSVQAASLSRDGTRLAFAVRRGNATVLLLTRVVRRSDGTPTGFTRFRALPSEHGLRDVRGLAWRDPATVAVLTRPSMRTSGIELVSCDGSSRLINLTPPVDVLFDRGTSLAASPGGPLALAVATVAGRTYELDPEGRWELGSVREGLAAPTYVG